MLRIINLRGLRLLARLPEHPLSFFCSFKAPMVFLADPQRDTEPLKRIQLKVLCAAHRLDTFAFPLTPPPSNPSHLFLKCVASYLFYTHTKSVFLLKEFLN